MAHNWDRLAKLRTRDQDRTVKRGLLKKIYVEVKLIHFSVAVIPQISRK
jgi:hypothetical protein